MAINYNEDGMFLGYFETLGSLMAQYNGRRGNFAVVKDTFWVHNGQRWISTATDTKSLKEALESLIKKTGDLSNIVNDIQISGLEMIWAFRSDIDAEAPAPDGWFKNPLTPDADNPVCYVSSRYRIADGSWSVWSEPSVFSRYVPEPVQAPGMQNIYIQMQDGISQATLYQELLMQASLPDYQSDMFVPEGGWSEAIPEPTEGLPYVYVSTRKKTSGTWGLYSRPVIGYRYIKGEDGKDGNNAWRIVLDNERVFVPCDKNGAPVASSQTVSTGIRLFNGGEQVTEGVTYSYHSASDAKPVINAGGTATLALTSETPEFYQIYLTATYGGKTYAAPWNIEKRIPTEDGESPTVYRLAPSAVAINRATDSLSPKHVSLNLFRYYKQTQVKLSEEDARAMGVVLVFTTPDGTSAGIPYRQSLFVWYGDGTITDEKVIASDAGTQIECSTSGDIRITALIGEETIDEQTIIMTRDGDKGEDGEVDYTVVNTYVADYINNDKEWGQFRTVIKDLLDENGNLVDTFVTTSTFLQTAETITAEVKNEFSAAGLEITSDGVTLYGDKVLIKPTKGSTTYTALFDSDGFLNANFIRSQSGLYYDNNGYLRASANRYLDGMYHTYYHLSGDTDEAKNNPPKQLEIGWDENTQSVLRLYDKDGNIIKALTMDGEIGDPVYQDTSDFESIQLCEIAWREGGDSFVGQTYTDSKTYYKHKTNGKLYSAALASDAYLVTAVLTRPGTTNYRTVYWYENGVVAKKKSYLFATPGDMVIDNTVTEVIS